MGTLFCQSTLSANGGLQGGAVPSVAGVGPLFELQTSPTDHLAISAIYCGIICPSGYGTQTCLGVGTPAIKGIGVFGSSFIHADGGDTTSLPLATLFTVWQKPPTAPTTYLRRVSTQGAGTVANGVTTQPILFRFKRSLMLPPSSSIVVWVATTSVNGINEVLAFDPCVEIEEGA